MQTSPISASVNGTPVVIGSGKMGYVYEMNANTGKLIWKAAVGEHNGHDNDSLEALQHTLALNFPYTIDLPLTFTNRNEPAPTAVAGRPAGEGEAVRLATRQVQWDRRP